VIPDVLSALRQLVRNDGPVLAIVTDAQRVYAGSMPASESAAQPRAAVILARSGGPGDRGRLRIGRYRVDVRSYGATEFEAARLSNAVHELFKASERVRVSSGGITPTLLHGLTLEGGPADLKDADGDWPLCLRTYEVLAAEVAA
jgi:hypothetical protein